MYNATKLTRELNNNGIANGGCNSGGVVWGVDGLSEIQDTPEVQEVLLAHDPTDYSCEITPLLLPADGIAEYTLSVFCDNPGKESVDIDVWDASEQIGVINVSLLDGEGQHISTIGIVGTFIFKIDDEQVASIRTE